MLQTIGIIAIVLAVVIACVLVYATTRPDTFRIERSLAMQAPPDAVFALIQDFRKWQAWSPYEKMDPAMSRTFSGAANGNGAIYACEGNKVGAGRMEILDASPTSRVKIQLDFTKPIVANHTAEFTMQPHGEATHVTWAMYGKSPFVAKLMGIFLSMDRMCGKDFETGLRNLKTVTEAKAGL